MTTNSNLRQSYSYDSGFADRTLGDEFIEELESNDQASLSLPNTYEPDRVKSSDYSEYFDSIFECESYDKMTSPTEIPLPDNFNFKNKLAEIRKKFEHKFESSSISIELPSSQSPSENLSLVEISSDTSSIDNELKSNTKKQPKQKYSKKRKLRTISESEETANEDGDHICSKTRSRTRLLKSAKEIIEISSDTCTSSQDPFDTYIKAKRVKFKTNFQTEKASDEIGTQKNKMALRPRKTKLRKITEINGDTDAEMDVGDTEDLSSQLSIDEIASITGVADSTDNDLKISKTNEVEDKAKSLNTEYPDNEPLAIQKEQEDNDNDNFQEGETYHNYTPMKLKIGKPHPDNIVESVSMRAVEPPDIWYESKVLKEHEKVVTSGRMSNLQIEAMLYACQQHETLTTNTKKTKTTRNGFLVGDGAGVGKGRIISGIIWENWLKNRRRHLWITASQDLWLDSSRDLRDIGAIDIPVIRLNQHNYSGVELTSNDCETKNLNEKDGVLFCTYSSLIGENKSHVNGIKRSRMQQIIEWLRAEESTRKRYKRSAQIQSTMQSQLPKSGSCTYGVIAFDECHRAKNLIGGDKSGHGGQTKTGKGLGRSAVISIQEKNPYASIVYASATGASEPRHMAYMSRLNLWGENTPFADTKNFIEAIDKHGVAAMELVAMDMKRRGVYLARQLSFQRATFQTIQTKLDDTFKLVYNKAVELWAFAKEVFEIVDEILAPRGVDGKTIAVGGWVHFKQIASPLIFDPCISMEPTTFSIKNTHPEKHNSLKKMWCMFWGAHQRFFKYMTIAAKIKDCVKLSEEAIKEGKCVIIGLQTTGETRTNEHFGRHVRNVGLLEEFISTTAGVFEDLVLSGSGFF